MTLKFNPLFTLLTFALLLIEIAIAYFLKDGFIRFTVGDFLASILVYCAIKSVIKMKAIQIALTALIISFTIEFAQLINLLDLLNLRTNKLASIILGSHFSIEDLIAYALGIITIYFIDITYLSNENH
ncbi:DUF2809 domain-containing protein [Psychroserpens sp. NJDZ02]|uniref:ribosomal maturation YjgA family protein n=1 Tax=Psychroserpens sp. NJDZ02 TaxID=2570561 RepID=UPI0010A7C32D|nr:DUF2809 domain-containing protein [Psychroserpens sp. NJDZ02]QCE41847.1 DUF2809 domain-containing protein [Psychroserpens sp. NJDZ02]